MTQDQDIAQVWDRIAQVWWTWGVVKFDAATVEATLQAKPRLAAEAAQAGYPETLSAEEIAVLAERSWHEIAYRREG